MHAKAAATWKKAETRKERDIIKWCEIMPSGTRSRFPKCEKGVVAASHIYLP